MNSEGELPLDVATEDAMERLLKGEIKKQGEESLCADSNTSTPALSPALLPVRAVDRAVHVTFMSMWLLEYVSVIKTFNARI